MAHDDAELLRKITKNKAKRKKYRQIMKTIKTAKMNTKSHTTTITSVSNFATSTKSKADKVSGAGYEYLSNFNSKLNKELSTIEDYVEYVNTSIEEIYYFYENIESEEKAVDKKISSDVDKYNKDKPIWEWQTKF